MNATTTESKTYNGWTNYESWNLALWLDNDQGSCSYWREQAQEAYDNATADKYRTRKEDAEYKLAEQLKNEIEEANPLAKDASFFSDVLRAAISEVNFDEIAHNWMEEIDEEEDETEEAA